MKCKLYKIAKKQQQICVFKYGMGSLKLCEKIERIFGDVFVLPNPNVSKKMCEKNFDCLNTAKMARNRKIRIACLMLICNQWSWNMQPLGKLCNASVICLRELAY